MTFVRKLEAEPWRFDLYQALRWLECAHPDQPRWAESRHVADDALRLGQEPTLAFAPATLASFRPGTEQRPARLRVFHPGLFGANGPLPFHLTEYARERQANQGDPTFARFADVFHHRMIALFYRAWSSAQPAVQYDRPETDRIALLLGALIGMGSPSLRRRGAWVDRILLHHAGGFAIPTRHAEGLAGLLADFFRSEVRVEGFVGHWIDLPPGETCRLGDRHNATLGRTATVGDRVWDCQHKFRVVLGPLGFEDYCRLLPGRESFGRLRALVRGYAGDDLFWDANVVLRKEEIPPLVLGGPGQLGWTTWLHSRPATRDSDELMLDPEVHAA